MSQCLQIQDTVRRVPAAEHAARGAECYRTESCYTTVTWAETSRQLAL